MNNFHQPLSAKHLTHKYASIHGCTLSEVLVIFSGYFVAQVIIALATSFFLRSYLGGYIGALLLQLLPMFLFTFFVLLPKTGLYLSKCREGKPAGFVSRQTHYVLHKYLKLPIPFVTAEYTGCWSTRRSER